MPTPAIPSEIFSSLNNISGANISLLLETFHNPEKKKDLLESLNILQSNNTIDQTRNSCQSHTKSGVLKRIDNKNLKRLGKAMLVSHNIFHAKRITQSYIYIV